MPEVYAERDAQLAEENEKLRRALIEIKEHLDRIEEIYAELGDLAIEDAEEERTAATDDEIKELLKKYSRL